MSINRNVRGARLALALLWLLAACQPAPTAITSAPTNVPAAEDTAAPAEATEAPEDDATSAAEPTEAPWLTVDPVAVTPVLDGAHGVGQVLGYEGGTLTATGTDGAEFSLTIPEGALFGSVLVSLTPVSALENLPLSGGLAAAAQLEPDGLWLIQPATLIITPAAALAPEQQDFFAYRGAGDDWHAYPPVTSTAALALSVYHFSGYGVGGGTEADRIQQAGRAPADRMAQIEAAIAEIFRREKEAQQQTGHSDPDFSTLLNAQIRRAYTEVVHPTVEAALASDEYDLVADAIKVIFSWTRFVALSDPEAFPAERAYLNTATEQLFLHGVATASQECAEQHNYVRIATLFQLARSLALIGIGDQASPLDRLKDCMHFELKLRSVMTEGGFGDPYGYRYELEATVPLALPTEGDEFIKGRLVGVGPLKYVSVAWIGSPPCTFDAAGEDAELNVRDGVNGIPFPFTPNTTTVEIVYDPGLPAEAVTMSCPSADPLSWLTNAWKGYFDIMHAAEKIENSYKLITPMLGGDIIVRSQQHLTTSGPSGQEVIEATLIQIVHKPVK